MLAVEPAPVGIQDVGDGVVSLRPHASTYRLDDSLDCLHRIPPGPAMHALLDQLVTQRWVGDLDQDLETCQFIAEVNALGHAGRHENRGLLGSEVLLQRLLAVR